jgi:protein-tyrosine phosphatase
VTKDSPDGFTDLHSHLVPGVDDGSRSLEDAREGLKKLWMAGVRTVVTTPHLDGSLTHDAGRLGEKLETVDQAFRSLQNMATAEFPGMALHQGYEVMLDIPDPDLADSRLRMADTRYMLVEWPGLSVPPSTLPVLRRLMDLEVKPIIAHPERYRELDREVRIPGEWKDAGALLQVNYGSLVGRYGDLPRRRALLLLERGWVDLLASDFHGRPNLSPKLLEARRILLEEGGGGQFGLLAGVNPGRILRNEDPIPVPPLTVRSGLWQRVLKALRPRGSR